MAGDGGRLISRHELREIWGVRNSWNVVIAPPATRAAGAKDSLPISEQDGETPLDWIFEETSMTTALKP
jgi:hypothetical protein